ncbi:Mu transposase domain-containing protein [Acidaminococcus fermentans]|uniref:Mu transposase domain-containing protein n=1 Tax=Acidaminococcus fermentans TaxID=905 RepID=UPI003AF3DED8
MYANTHKIPGRENPVKDLLLEDQKRLCPLPGSPFDASRAAVCRVTPFSVVRFVANDYSVPVKYVGQEVTVRAYAEQIRIFAKGELIAEHARNYGQNQQILKLAHYLPLLEYCTCQQKLDTKLKKSGIKNESMYKIHQLF